HRPPGDVLVGDVDVRGIPSEGEDPLTALVPQGRRRPRLALGPVALLAVARNNLQRDVEAAPLVARQPDMAHPAGAERPDRAVAMEEEVGRSRRRGHPPLLRLHRSISFADRGRGYIRPQMDTPDDDLEFDFFEDEPATTEAPSHSRVRLPGRGGRGTGIRRPTAP